MNRVVPALAVVVLVGVAAASLPASLAAQMPPPGGSVDPTEPVVPTPRERLDELLERFRRHIEPGLEGLGDLLGDLSGWYPPEVLPNGDILIRRRPRQSPEDEAPVTEPFEL